GDGGRPAVRAAPGGPVRRDAEAGHAQPGVGSHALRPAPHFQDERGGLPASATLPAGSSSVLVVIATKTDERSRSHRGAAVAAARPRPWQGCLVAGEDIEASLRQAGVSRGDLVGLAVSPSLEVGLATADRSWTVPGAVAGVRRADEALRPRWVTWSGQTAA